MWIVVAESNLPEKGGTSIVEKFDDVFNFEIMSERDNLNNWLLNAEFNSFKDRTKKKFRLHVFHDVNGPINEKKTPVLIQHKKRLIANR